MEPRAEIDHGDSMGIVPIECKRRLYGKFSNSPDAHPMDIWPQRSQFRAYVKQYRQANRCKLEDVAAGIGLKDSSLKDYLYRKDVKPSIEVLQNASRLFGCSLTEFVDDPAGALSGVATSEEMAKLTEAKRLVAKMLFHDLSGDALSDEQAMAYYRAWEGMISAGRLKPGQGIPK